MTPREWLLADIDRLADELDCVRITDGRLEVGAKEAHRMGLDLIADDSTGDERLDLLLELARTDLLPGGVRWLERLQDA